MKKKTKTRKRKWGNVQEIEEEGIVGQRVGAIEDKVMGSSFRSMIYQGRLEHRSNITQGAIQVLP